MYWNSLRSSDFTTSYAKTGVFDRPEALSRPAAGEPYVTRPGDEQNNPFGHVIINLRKELPSFGMRHIAHELGHAMFNLADEYVGQQLGFDGRLEKLLEADGL